MFLESDWLADLTFIEIAAREVKKWAKTGISSLIDSCTRQ